MDDPSTIAKQPDFISTYDAIILELIKQLKETEESIFSRHADLEYMYSSKFDMELFSYG